MKKKSMKILVIILVVIAVLSIGFIYIKLNNNEKKPIIEEFVKEDEIKKNNFDYVLYGHKSDLYKDYFAKLKEELLKDEIDEEEYAKNISALFVVDFYSLDEKTTSTDIGGLDFIYPAMKDNFILKSTDKIYKNIESNVYGERKQSLPKVTDLEIKSIKKEEIEIDDVKDENGYTCVVTVTYEKNMGYPKEITLKIVHQENKLYILEVK